jgi:hypothetical protein
MLYKRVQLRQEIPLEGQTSELKEQSFSSPSVQERVEASSGRCRNCSCPGFQGVGYTCTRGGCGHHYDLHG